MNAWTADALLRIRLPKDVCGLMGSELDCQDKHGCVFCAGAATNESHCYAADTELPAWYE